MDLWHRSGKLGKPCVAISAPDKAIVDACVVDGFHVHHAFRHCHLFLRRWRVAIDDGHPCVISMNAHTEILEASLFFVIFVRDEATCFLNYLSGLMPSHSGSSTGARSGKIVVKKDVIQSGPVACGTGFVRVLHAPAAHGGDFIQTQVRPRFLH